MNVRETRYDNVALRVAVYAEDTVLIKEGECLPFMYYISKGSVALYTNYGEDGEYLIGIVSAGKAVGEMGLLDSEPSIYSVVAISEVEVVKITKENMEIFISTNPHLAINMIKCLANANRMMKKNMDMLISDINELSEENKRKKELDLRLAKYRMWGMNGSTDKFFNQQGSK